MLQLKNIVKTYEMGSLTQKALKDVSISFRENEFVSILGQSGSGKTTMLNIIGGLDRYTSGDLIIGGVSTKEYKDSDWDIYRNNKIGFVFQSYNLIPHQTVLANVELALTLAGVSKKERRERAAEALKKVGLEEHIHKRPNQMSGGQMQRVAIARALVNNPDILLADEPTGALDSETSLQIMELLKEIAKDKLVIMVTHNPELAEKYSTRIVNLKDGVIISDTMPYNEDEEKNEPKKQKKVSMSFSTALALSFNNLKTKKGRTLLTSFAGSIGIIGIALILALSTGMNQYISDVQKETMTSYPITITSETLDTAGLLGLRAKIIGEVFSEKDEDRTAIHSDYMELQTSYDLKSSITKNNLTAFKKYLDNPDSEIRPYIGENGIIYGYDVKFNVYTHDSNGDLLDTDSDAGEKPTSPMDIVMDNEKKMMKKMMGGGMTGSFMDMMSEDSAMNFTELMVGNNGESVSQVITDSYDLLYGRWPENYDEVILVLGRNNVLSAETLYQLGFITGEKYNEIEKTIKKGEEAEEIIIDYEEACKQKLYLVPACDHYIENEDGTFTFIEDPALNEEELLKNATELKITGVIRPIKGAENATIATPIAYTSALTDYVVEHTRESNIIKAQMSDPETNVLNGVRFEPATTEEKIADITEYIKAMEESEKASLYKLIMLYTAEENQQSATPQQTMGNMPNMTPDDSVLAMLLEQWLENDPDEEVLLQMYDQYIGEYTYEDNMKAFGSVSYEAPSSISIFTDSFENKDAIAECIENYNQTADEDSKISYTDYVAMMTSSLTTIINGISYVLIAFVAISLVVSCIMIGIITHISVMERTKEIGILRSVGASKKDISHVFNAETFIVGCCAGVLGIGVSLLSLIPINAVIEKVTGIAELNAKLPIPAAIILVLISTVITIIGGLLPSKKAANKDPVIALRTE